MNGNENLERNPLTELRFALAEADATDAPAGLRDRLLERIASVRSPGRSLSPPTVIRGAEVFRRTVERLDALLGALDDDEWHQPTIRDLDVQHLVGHLIGVEEAFVRSLGTGVDPLGPDGHVSGTASTVDRQSSRPPAETHRDWFEQATASIAATVDVDPAEVIPFYGVQLPIDWLLVVRAFEMWIHDEDVRRATGRPLSTLDPERLGRMVALATSLLPAGMARASRASERAVRLVLTGPGGGTWNVNLDGADEPRPHAAMVVVDATHFCRVVGDRADLTSTGAIVSGDLSVARDVFAGAAALALD